MQISTEHNPQFPFYNPSAPFTSTDETLEWIRAYFPSVLHLSGRIASTNTTYVSTAQGELFPRLSYGIIHRHLPYICR